MLRISLAAFVNFLLSQNGTKFLFAKRLKPCGFHISLYLVSVIQNIVRFFSMAFLCYNFHWQGRSTVHIDLSYLNVQHEEIVTHGYFI